MVAATAPDRETRMLPGTMPKMAPEVIVRGMAGTASTYTTARL